jgi:dolichyl-phosphate-mannose--protein O-mannosyl transferase
MPTLTTADAFLSVSLYFASAALHLYRLPFPDCVVFDETHFGSFIHDYLSRSFFLDIHPPLPKLIYLACALLSHYDSSLDFSGGPYANEWYIQFRILNALLSSFCAPLLFLVLRNCSISETASVCAALVFLCETCFLPQQRFILTDGILHFCVLFHLLVLSIDFVNPLWIGISAGLACSCKFTALPLIPFTVCVLRFRVYRILSVLISAFLFFVFMNWVHLQILVRPTAEGRQLLEKGLHTRLFENRSAAGVVRGSLEINFAMIDITVKNRRFHPYQSEASSWPLLTGIWVGLWEAEDRSAEVKCLGNPFCFGFVFLALLGSVWNSKATVVGLAWVGYILTYAPFLFVGRAKFLYHYQVPLLFGFLALGAAIDRFSSTRWAVVGCALFGFLYWAPFVYGYEVKERKSRIWNPVWATGGTRHRTLVHEFFGVWIE